jgi:hypothetical protein
LARIEREEKAIARAKELREKEKQRAARKKKKAEKEAKAREERRRLGLPDPDAPKVPSSQPLLLKFFDRKPPTQGLSHQESPPSERSPMAVETDQPYDSGDTGMGPLPPTEDDEFSDCSIFNDEDVIKEADIATAVQLRHQTQLPMPNQGIGSPTASSTDSFRDDTANYLEEVFAYGCDDSFAKLIGL